MKFLNKKKKIVNVQIKLSENILLLSEIKYNGLDDLQTFYNNFRNMVCKQLKKKGDIIKSTLKNLILDYNEIISHTFDEIILVWCLEKIHPKFPRLIIKKLENKSSLELSKENIFNLIPSLINFDTKDTFENELNISDKIESDLLKGELNIDYEVNTKDGASMYSEDEKEVNEINHDMKEVRTLKMFSQGFRDGVMMDK